MPSDKGVLKIVDEHKPNMAGSMNQEDFEDLKQSFAMFDRNGDGKISTKELGVVMRSMGMKPTEKELKSIIDEVDKDGDGEVDFEEFVSTMSRTQQRQEIDDKEIRRAFDVFDQNGDGKITLSELKVVMSTIGEDMTESDLAEMMKGADLNNDGYISYEELVLGAVESTIHYNGNRNIRNAESSLLTRSDSQTPQCQECQQPSIYYPDNRISEFCKAMKSKVIID